MAVDVSELVAGVHRLAAGTMAIVGPMVEEKVRTDPRTPYRDGELRDSVTSTATYTGSGTGYAARLSVPVVQARTTDQGARPHVIRPRSRKYLKFTTSSGRVVFARVVQHPGNPPRPWFAAVVRDAFAEALPVAARAAAP